MRPRWFSRLASPILKQRSFMRLMPQREIKGPRAATEVATGDLRQPSISVQQLWFQVHERAWSSLVLVPADPGGSAAGVAANLAKVGAMLGDVAPRVLNSERMDAAMIVDLIADLSSPRPSAASGDSGQRRTLISIDSVLFNPMGIGIAQAADAVLLCVRTRRTKLAQARRTVELIGSDRFIGSVILSAAR